MTFKEYGLQDGNTLEATQTMLKSRAVGQFPLNDQEILLRHLHKTAGGYVAEYQQEVSHVGPDLQRIVESCPPPFLYCRRRRHRKAESR